MRYILSPRTELAEARLRLGVSQRQAAVFAGCSHKTIDNWEMGSGRGYPQAVTGLRKLCRAFMRIAVTLGYDADAWHESKLCPGEFPDPGSDEEEVAA
jgi:transcriptional regulator with XRE-family HTH domain